jgi:hypothetical protein
VSSTRLANHIICRPQVISESRHAIKYLGRHKIGARLTYGRARKPRRYGVSTGSVRSRQRDLRSNAEMNVETREQTAELGFERYLRYRHVLLTAIKPFRTIWANMPGSENPGLRSPEGF